MKNNLNNLNNNNRTNWLYFLLLPILFSIGPKLYFAALDTFSSAEVKSVRKLNIALNNNEFDYVIKHSKIYLEEYPESDQIWLALGWAYYRNCNYFMAAESFKQAIEHNETNDSAYVGLGASYHDLGNMIAAEECYDEAIRICPPNPSALISLCTLELDKGNYDLAIKYGEEAWAVQKRLAVIPANLSIAYHCKGDVTKRTYYYKVAKELDYSDLEVLEDIFANRLPIFDKSNNEIFFESP